MKQLCHRLAIGILGLAVVLGLTGTANAEIKDNSWELGLFANYAMMDSDSVADDAMGYGFRFGYNFKKGHEIEFMYVMVPTEDSFGYGIDVDINTWTLGYVYNFMKDKKLVPYATVAFGSTNTSADEVDFDEDDTTYLLGGGIRYSFSDLIAIRGGFSYIMVQSDPDSTSNMALDAGVSFFLGGK